MGVGKAQPLLTTVPRPLARNGVRRSGRKGRSELQYLGEAHDHSGTSGSTFPLALSGDISVRWSFEIGSAGPVLGRLLT